MQNSEQNLFRIISAALGIATNRTAPIERRNYPHCTIEYVDFGRGYLEEGGITYTLEQDDIYFLYPGQDHRYYPDRAKPWGKIFLSVEGPLMTNILESLLPPGIWVFHQANSLRHYFDTFLTLALSGQAEKDRKAALLFHRLIYDLALLHESQTGREDGPEFELKRALEDSLGSTFRLGKYAEKVHYTKSYLIRKFRQTFGSTPYEYLLEQRLRKAEDLLRFTALPVKEIAEMLAFSGQAAFSHYFAKRNRIAPAAYRKSLYPLKNELSGMPEEEFPDKSRSESRP